MYVKREIDLFVRRMSAEVRTGTDHKLENHKFDRKSGDITQFRITAISRVSDAL